MGGELRRAVAYVGMWESRLEGLERVTLGDGLTLLVAERHGTRLAGLAGLRAMPRRTGLLFPGCRSVQTVGMRFKLDLIWLAAHGRIVDVTPSVPPWRVVTRAHASAVVESPAGTGALFFAAIAAAPPGAIPTRRRAARAGR